MGILATLKKDNLGGWLSLSDYLREAYLRETAALAALAGALGAPVEEQKELFAGENGPLVLLELARDLRVPKGSRLAAARALLEAGAPAQTLGELFAGAGDLVTDPRLGSAARKLVESGLPPALQAGGEISRVSLAAGAFARGVHSAASAVGQARVKELLAGAPEGHAGAAASLFAMGLGDLPPAQLEQWKELLTETCAANKRAPAAAKRMGLAPPWPPNVPDAFNALVQEAQAKNAEVKAADAAANPELLKRAPVAPTIPVKPATPQRIPGVQSTSELVGSKVVGPAIKRSPFRKSIGSTQEVPTRVPAKPMEEVKARATSNALPAPTEKEPDIAPKDEAPRIPKFEPLPGIVPLSNREVEQIRFDPSGKKIPRPDRWEPVNFEWELPDLPSSDLPQPGRVGLAQGPFTQRLQSLFDDRPEAVDRLCAAAEARSARLGEARALEELSKELAQKKWAALTLPLPQRARLKGLSPDAPPSWRAVARLLLEKLPEEKA